MVKVKSKHGDTKKGRQDIGVYQARYGRGIRRKFTEKKGPRSAAQKETTQRFQAGAEFAGSLNSTEIETIKARIKELGLKTSWYNFAKKAVMQRADFEISAAEGETIEWEIRVGHSLLETLEVYDEGETLVYKLDKITDLEAGYICSVHKVALDGYLKKIVVKSYAEKIYESIDLNLIGGKYMRKEVYDQNENGIVDNSEKLEGKTLAKVREHDPKVHAHSQYATKTEAVTYVYVPDDFDKIQDAIDSLPEVIKHTTAIRIDRGTYNEDIDFVGHFCIADMGFAAFDKSESRGIYDNGQATGGGNNTLENTGESWPIDFFNGGKVFIYLGTGLGQIRDITDTTATEITVSPNWTVTPDATSYYVITGLTKINGKFTNSNIDRLTMQGLTFTKDLAGYPFGITGVNTQLIKYCEFYNPSGQGLRLVNAYYEAMYNHYNAKWAGLICGTRSSGYMARASLFEAQITGSGVGLQATAMSTAMLAASPSTSVFKDYDTGIRALYFGYVFNGSLQTFQNCITDFTPAGGDPSVVT